MLTKFKEINDYVEEDNAIETMLDDVELKGLGHRSADKFDFW
jgi:hypothetical protein